MSQKVPVNKFERIKDISKFNEDFMKTVMKKAMKYIFLKLMFIILNINFKKEYLLFLSERMKIEKV